MGGGADAGAGEYRGPAGVRQRRQALRSRHRPGHCDPMPGGGAVAKYHGGGGDHDHRCGVGKAGHGFGAGRRAYGQAADPAASSDGKRQAVRNAQPGRPGGQAGVQPGCRRRADGDQRRPVPAEVKVSQ